jgi:hypothetical protein
MSKMGSHDPFGHMQHKLWQKERSGVKLAVWLLTTKSQESTRPRCVQVVCDTPLENSWQELQVCFSPHPNRRSKQKVITSQSGGSPNRDSFGTPPWESRDKKPFRCRCHRETQIILYGGRWWLPSSRAVVSLVSTESPVTCPNTKGAPESELTNLLVGWMQIWVSNQKLVTLPSPIPELQHAPSTPFSVVS